MSDGIADTKTDSKKREWVAEETYFETFQLPAAIKRKLV